VTEARYDAARADADFEPDPRRWRILTVTLVIGFMALLDVTIVNVALPSIRAGLGASAAGVQWIVSGYALAFGLTLVAGGRLGDAFGRRRMMLIGLTGFILSSAAVGLSPNEGTVIAARLVQGVAAGLLTPQNSGLIQQLFRGPERGRAFGYFGLTVSVSAAAGPILGGLIIAALGEDLGWRAIFLVNVPIGLVALVFVARLVPRKVRAADDADQVEAGVGVVGRGGAPLLDVALLGQSPGYASGIALGTLYFTGFTGVFLVLSVHLQEALDLSPLETGLALTPFAVGSALTATIAGRWVSRIGRRVTVIALVVVIAGLAVVAVLVPGHSGDGLWPLLALPLLLAGLGGGGVVSPNFTLTLADVPPRMGGAAGGALQTGQRIGSALGAAVMMTAYQVTIARTDDTGTGLLVALGVALVLIGAALVLAVRDLRLDADRTLTHR